MGKLPFMKFFPGDFDRDMSPHPLEIRGAWITILDHLWNQDIRGEASYSMLQWGRILGVDEIASKRIIDYIMTQKIADCNGECNGNVTLISRRIKREEKERDFTRLRVAKLRGKESCNADVTDDVTQMKRQCNGVEVRSQKLEVIKDNYIGHFESFWKSYPKRVGKQAALRSWNKAKNKPPIEKILSVLELQKKSDQWKKESGQFIPNPATWINQGRWDDEIKEESWVQKVESLL